MQRVKLYKTSDGKLIEDRVEAAKRQLRLDVWKAVEGVTISGAAVNRLIDHIADDPRPLRMALERYSSNLRGEADQEDSGE